MHVPLIAALLLAPALQDLDALPPRTVERPGAGGSRWVLTVVDHPSRGELRHGAAERLAADGTQLEAGDFSDGARDGRWRFRWPNGELMASGKYRAGSKLGSWTFRYPDEDRGNDGVYASGKYKDGQRDGRWSFYDRQGQRQTAEFEAVVDRYPEGGLLRCGALRDGRLDGRWTLHWSDGRLASSQHFDDGRPVGEARVYHPDGFEEPVLFARHATGVELWPVQALMDADRAVERELAPLAEAPSAPTDGLEGLEATLERELGQLLDRLEGRTDASAEAARARAVAVGAVLAFGGVDDPDGPLGALKAEHGADALGWLARSVFAGERWGSAVLDPQHGLRYLARAATVAHVSAWDPTFQSFERRAWADLPLEVDFSDSISAVIEASARERTWTARLNELRDEHRRVRFRPWSPQVSRLTVTDRQRLPAVEAGLRWLAAHQESTGEWNPATFVEHGDEAEQALDRTGQEGFAFGVTAVALQAFVDAGVGLDDPEFGPAVMRATSYLLSYQNPETGRIGYTSGSASNYAHAASMIVLAQLHRRSAHPALASALERAIPSLEAAKATYGVWRYDVEKNPGEGDVSVTSWVWRALHEAHRALGTKMPVGQSEDVLTFLNEVTDSSGRVGYQQLGEVSSRFRESADRFPADQSENLTACGLVTRTLIGRSTDLDWRVVPFDGRDAIDGGVARLDPKLVAWDEHSATDLYSWLHATKALGLLREEYPGPWRAWSRKVQEVLLAKQLVGEEHGTARGSWPSDTAWGTGLGAVFTTALAVSTLCEL